MPANNAKTSHKGAAGGAVPIKARGAGNKQGSARIVAANAGKGTTGNKRATVKGNAGKGTVGKKR